MSATDFAAMKQAWARVEAEAARLRHTTLLDLFAADPLRAERLTFAAPHLIADFSKQRVDSSALTALQALANAADFEGWREKLFAGDIVNTTEGRAAKHWALRITDPPGGDNEITRVLDRMHAFAHDIAESGKFDAIIHLGIGGSDLGPRLVLDALKSYRRPNLTVRF
ncbi:MAG: glucose-6-phosphate isomerase, partial [Caulobacteraceae bacterium]